MCSDWALFSFIMCFFIFVEQRSSLSKQNSFQTGSHLSFSCGGETRVPLWLQSSEDMEKCSKGRATWNLGLFLPWLLDYTGLVCKPQMNLYASPSLVSIPSHILLIKFALIITQRHFPCRALHPQLGVHADRFSFLFLTNAWFPRGPTQSQSPGLGSAQLTIFIKCQTWFWCASNIESHCWRGEWVNQMEIPTNQCSLPWLHIRITKRAFKMQEYPGPDPWPEEFL